MNKEQNSPTGSQSAELTCYAFGFDLHYGEGVICCFCYKNILEESEAPNLLASITKPSEPIPGDALCPKCNLPYLRGQTEEAAKTIQEKWL